jgi:hypothetical protein
MPRLRQKMRKLKRPSDGQGRPAKALCITNRCALRIEENLRKEQDAEGFRFGSPGCPFHLPELSTTLSLR